jgi:serine/threonine protein kinase HipA of HipAB toxin-antitoxin module
MAVGNADAHAKNFSILHDTDNPAISLAPLYDVLSTIALELADSAGQPMRADTHLGQRVGSSTLTPLTVVARRHCGDRGRGTRSNGPFTPMV